MKQSMLRAQFGLLALFLLMSAWSAPLALAQGEMNDAGEEEQPYFEDIPDGDEAEVGGHVLEKRDANDDYYERKDAEFRDQLAPEEDGHALEKRDANTDYYARKDEAFLNQLPPEERADDQRKMAQKQAPVRMRSMNDGGDDLAAGSSKMRLAGLAFIGYFCFAMIVLGIIVMLDKAGFPIRRDSNHEDGSSYRSRSTA